MLEFGCLLRSGVAAMVLSRCDEKGRKVEAVGDSFWWPAFEVKVMKGSFPTLDTTLPKSWTGNLGGVMSGESCVNDLSRREDLDEPSSGEKAVSLVSGVPLNESAPPADECGEDGLKPVAS